MADEQTMSAAAVLLSIKPKTAPTSADGRIVMGEISTVSNKPLLI